jgi:hypothetical protein
MWRATPCFSPFLWRWGLPAGSFSRFCLLRVCVESSSYPPPFSCVLKALCPLWYVSFSVPSLFFRVFFFFLQSGGQSVQEAILVYPRGSCGSAMYCLFGHLLVCFSQTAALLVSQSNMAWRSFMQAGGSGCQSFAYSWCFFSAKCGCSVSVRFFIYRSHTVCFLPLVTILHLFILLICDLYIFFSEWLLKA